MSINFIATPWFVELDQRKYSFYVASQLANDACSCIYYDGGRCYRTVGILFHEKYPVLELNGYVWERVDPISIQTLDPRFVKFPHHVRYRLFTLSTL